MKLPTQVLTLKQFLLRQESLKLYRQVLRVARQVGGHQRAEIEAWARSDFEQHRHQQDPESIKYLLHNGRQMLKQLQQSMGK